MVGLLVLVVVLAVSTGGGLLWQRRTGRLRPTRPTPVPAAAAAVPPTEPALLAGLGVDPAGAPVTLVQFSSAFCQPCRATRRVLGEVVRLLPAVGYVEVDAESHLAAVRALGILRTPTVLVLDPAGRVVQRASGQPRLADVIAAVAPHLPDRSADRSAEPEGERARPAGRQARAAAPAHEEPAADAADDRRGGSGRSGSGRAAGTRTPARAGSGRGASNRSSTTPGGGRRGADPVPAGAPFDDVPF